MNPASQFRIFGPQHLLLLLFLLILGFLISWGSRRMTDAGRKWLGWLLGFLLLSFAVTVYAQQAIEGSVRAEYSLPMELCDWVLCACLVTLFHRNDLASEIMYFWGCAGTFQALLTPDITQGFPSWQFVAFFWGHGSILLAVTYIVAAQKFRPRPGSVRRMMVMLNVYGLVALTIDLAFGWNYGYLLRKPAAPSIFSYLGPWPWYLFFVELIGLVSFWLLSLPWRILDMRSIRRVRSTGQGKPRRELTG